MAKTSLEKIASWDEEIAQIKNKQKLERQKHNREEQKTRNHRLCKRHALLEKMLPEIINITEEQYQTFLERAVANDYGRDKLNKIIVQGAANGIEKAPTGATPNAANATPKPTQTATPNNTAESAKADGGATVQG